MEGQLVAGQWVEVSMEDLPTPVLLNGFVLSLRPSEVLLTFPELLGPPDGLEAEARALVRYSDSAGNYTALGHIVRVASGPPVTVTLKRLVPLGTDPRRTPVPCPTLPVALHIVKSRVAVPFGPEGVPGLVQDLGEADMLLETSLLLSVGDTLRLGVGTELTSAVVSGRVIRVSESERKPRGQFRVGIELVFETDLEREHWMELVQRWRHGLLR